MSVNRVSQAGYARMMGCTVQMVLKAVDKGLIVNGYQRDENGNPYVIPDIASKEWAKNYDFQNSKNKKLAAALMKEGDIDFTTLINEEAKRIPKGRHKKRGPKPKSETNGQSNGAHIPNFDASDIEGDTVNMSSANKAKLAKTVMEAKIKQLEYEEKKGKLVDKEKVYKSLFEAGQELRNALIVIPDRHIDEIMASQTRAEAHTLLTDAINDALNKLSKIYKRDLVKR